MLLVLAMWSAVVWAQPAAGTAAPWKPDTGDTAWMLVSAALVLLMTPGLAFFYGGLVRSKNVLNTMLMSFGAMGVLGVLWLVCGYSIAFGGGGDGLHKYFGDLGWSFFNGVNVTDANPLAPTIPHQLFAVYQMMFFLITPALISGSLVERMKFSTYMIFIALWGLLVYCPVAHWVWGGGWIGGLGVMDFAGGAVVHVNAGFAALAAVLALGPRREYQKAPLLPHSLPLCLLGVGLLWFGWFGFNAGSALGSGTLATAAFVNTQIATVAALLTWMLVDQVTRKQITALGAGTGAVAGLVGITPACGFVSPLGALLVGAITSGVCYFSATMRAKSKLDDSLDAFAVHGIGGFTGAVLTGVFSVGALKTMGVSPLALPGLLEGGTGVFFNQLVATGAVALYTFVMSFVICKVLKAVMGLRVSEEAEHRGLDIHLHGEEAYETAGA
jgi:Amt family ammonium transporter